MSSRLSIDSRTLDHLWTHPTGRCWAQHGLLRRPALGIEHGPTRRELRRWRTLVIATLLAASGCAHAITATGQRSESVGVGAAVFTIRYSPADLDAARQVRRALR